MAMDSEGRPLESDRDGTLALERSGLRDEVERLEGRMSATLGSGLAITVLFAVGSAFMEQTSTLWFLGAIWLFFTLRLVLINRTTGRELRINEAPVSSPAAYTPSMLVDCRSSTRGRSGSGGRSPAERVRAATGQTSTQTACPRQ